MLYQCLSDRRVLIEPVQMMRKHVQHELNMLWMLTVAVQNSELQDLQPVCNTLFPLKCCISELAGLLGGTIWLLQHVQNSAECLGTGLSSREHITPALHQLHWLQAQTGCTDAPHQPATVTAIVFSWLQQPLPNQNFGVLAAWCTVQNTVVEDCYWRTSFQPCWYSSME